MAFSITHKYDPPRKITRDLKGYNYRNGMSKIHVPCSEEIQFLLQFFKMKRTRFEI